MKPIPCICQTAKEESYSIRTTKFYKANATANTAAAASIDPASAIWGAALVGVGDVGPPLVGLGAISEAAPFSADTAAERNEESIVDGMLET